MAVYKITSNRILNLTLILSIILAIIVFFHFRTDSWPGGLEALGCVGSILLILAALVILLLFKNKIIDDSQERNVASGLETGFLWTIEISINNLIQPGLPLRDYADNAFWAIIALLILVIAIREAYLTKRFRAGLRSGFWTGVASGAVACLTALVFIVFGMKYILSDPLNYKEWADLRFSVKIKSPDVYFAYQTFTGAIMHLLILGAIMGMILGIIGGLIGRILNRFQAR